MKIGFLDDEYTIYDSMSSTLKEYEIDLIKLDFIQDISEIEKIHNIIFENNLEALIVDYKLDKIKSNNKKGTKLIRMLSETLPDFPFFLLTNYPDEGINEFTIQKNYIFQKEIFEEDDDSEVIKNFVETIQNSIKCYKENIKRIEKEYLNLLEKKHSNKMDNKENHRFIYLYKILAQYNKVDVLPTELLETSFQKTIKDLQKSLKKFSSELEKNE